MIINKTPLPTVDCVVIYNNSVLLIKRKNPPYKGFLALPGGFIDIGETVEDACVRELYEETNLKLKTSQLKLVGVYSKPGRDPRRNTIAIAYSVHIKNEVETKAGDDATSVEFISDWKKKRLAFDHRDIIKDVFLKKNK